MNIELIHIFVKVVKKGSFSKAAELLGIPKSTVSKSIARLESEVGSKLLLRTTRSLTLTNIGKQFYESCAGPVQVIEEAQKTIIGSDQVVGGKIKLTSPEDLGTEIIAPAIGRLTQRFPDLRFELVYTDQMLDLVKEGFDLAVRVGPLRDSGLKFKKIGEAKLVLVASPEYLKNNKKIHNPEDLTDHSCLLRSSPLSKYKWQLKSQDRTSFVGINPKVVSNQMTSLIKASIEGAGVALVPAYLCRAHIESGKLVRILPEWTSVGNPISLFSPLPFSSSVRLKTVTDDLVEELKKAVVVDV